MRGMRCVYQWQMAALELDWIASAQLRGRDRAPTEIFCVPHHDIVVGGSPPYAAMASEYRTTYAARPYLNQCVIARTIGARAFNLSDVEVTANDREPALTEKRHRIMAFTRIVTSANYSTIGRAFHRDHGAVAYACSKYEDEIRDILGRDYAEPCDS